MALDKIIYTAHATATGGRDGSARSDDGKLEVRLNPPKEMGGNVRKGEKGFPVIKMGTWEPKDGSPSAKQGGNGEGEGESLN